MSNVAFLGLGSIGRPMAARITAAGFPRTVWNRTAERATSSSQEPRASVAPTAADRAPAFAKEHKASVARTAADAAREADVVITCMSAPLDVEQVLDAGLSAGIRDGAVLLDCTSGDPATSKRIARKLASKRVAFI